MPDATDPLDALFAEAADTRRWLAEALHRHRAAMERHGLASVSVRLAHEDRRLAPAQLTAMVDALDEMIAAANEHQRWVEALHAVEDRIEQALDAAGGAR
jgi:hypothetical protein